MDGKIVAAKKLNDKYQNMKLHNATLAPAPEVHKNAFRADIIKGLSEEPKKLLSKYFYDDEGSRTFQKIMAMPEYYLTRCELDIFKNRTDALSDALLPDDQAFDLIELGAGDATKSVYLLRHLLDKGAKFTYMPIDISGAILSVLEEKLAAQLPQLGVKTLEGDYFDMLESATAASDRRKIVLFLGGNIGNMEQEEALQFCRTVREKLNPGDLFLIGFDLKKNPKVILDAYNDPTGITARFNLNLLTRINRELGADFKTEQFQHYQHYDPISGACRSFLVSLCQQQVNVDGNTFHFDENELIDMEISQKFSATDIAAMATATGFLVVNEIKDSKKWFVDAVWQVL